ncbi:hypothetical protein AB4027_04720 [Alkalibacterium putridalgicola]|uniref:hypothetical protein n=1 Tax=Alkalibacterium putridalgicola TaxID=426703 RepID=UPI0034CFA351
MNEKLIQTINELEIKKAPEEQPLEAALNQYTKKQLAHFIERFDLDIAKSWKKAEIIEALIEWMESAQSELLESNEDLKAFYLNKVVNAKEPLEINDDLSDKEQERVLSLIEHGLVFNADGQLWAPKAADKTADTESDKPVDSGESSEETTSQEKPAETEKPKPRKKQRQQASATSLTPEERIAREKKMRLKYFKTQAKKNKKKR